MFYQYNEGNKYLTFNSINAQNLLSMGVRYNYPVHREQVKPSRKYWSRRVLWGILQRQNPPHSILFDLPYFDPIHYPVVDPMPNLFLGTGKHMMEVWLPQPQLISRQTLDDLEFLKVLGAFQLK